MLGYLQQNWGLSIYFEAISNGMLSMLSWSKDPSWRREEKEKRHRRMNRRYHRCIAPEHLVHYASTGVNSTSSDEPTVPFLVASDELEKRSREDSSVGWTDGSLEGTIGLFDDQVQTRQRHAKTSSSAPDELMTWSRRSVGLSDGYEETNRDGLARSPSAPDEPTHHQCIASMQFWQRTSTAMWRGRGTGWTDAPEK
jgi:hypothetical protein